MGAERRAAMVVRRAAPRESRAAGRLEGAKGAATSGVAKYVPFPVLVAWRMAVLLAHAVPVALKYAAARYGYIRYGKHAIKKECAHW